MLNFVSDALKGDLGKDTAVVIANLGQLVWWRRGKKAMSITSWNALPRKTGVSGTMRMDPVKNRVLGHANVAQHVQGVFEMVLETARKDAKIDIIGLGDGAEEAVKYLDAHWDQCEGRVRAMCVGLGYVLQVGHEATNQAFKSFWSKVSLQPRVCEPKIPRPV